MSSNSMATKEGMTVLNINNFDPLIRNQFKALCSLNGLTLKEGVLRVLKSAIEAKSLSLQAKPEK